ncbi:MAG: carbohydrate binding family 9 domain-containing protein [Sphingobacteriales bacterium]|nr:carbohydrate binding family 9 domain-containing protein [Sphingobacteriales bacterium]
MKNIKAAAIKGRIHADGKLNEPQWDSTAGITGFTQLEPDEGRPSAFQTRVKVLYDQKNLYIGCIAGFDDGLTRLRVPSLKRDFSYRQHDMFAVCMDGFNDRRNSMTFACNAGGAQKDYLAYDDQLFDSEWNGLWSVKTSVNDSAWCAEFVIPWKTLRYNNDSAVASFGINFLRVKRSANEVSVWSPYPRLFGFNRMEYAGKLSGIKLPRNLLNLQVLPYVLVSRETEKSAGIRNEVNTVHSGGDIRMGFRSGTALDLTYNTDFAQAEADVQVHNISRSSVYYPEKRSFFLENASLFGAGLNGDGENGIGGSVYLLPFFSRRIGIGSNGEMLPIKVAGKFVNRNSRSSAGCMFIRQGAYDTIAAGNAFIGRMTQNIGHSSHIGLFTSYTQKQDKQSRDNYTIAIDGFTRLGEKQSINALYTQSYLGRNSPAGHAGFLQYIYTSGRLNAWFTQSFNDKRYRPDLGFVSRQGTVSFSPGFIFNIYTANNKTIRSFQPGIQSQSFFNSERFAIQESEITIYPVWINFQKGGNFIFSVRNLTEQADSGLMVFDMQLPRGRYNFTRYAIAGSSDPSRRISYSARIENGAYYNGRLCAADLAFNITPLQYLTLHFNVNLNAFSNTGTGHVSKMYALFTSAAEFIPTTKIQFTGLYQHSSYQRNEGLSVKFSWEYLPLSFIHLVYNFKSVREPAKIIQDAAIVKAGLVKQF